MVDLVPKMCVFETDLGWMLLAGARQRVGYLSMGSETADDARQRWLESPAATAEPTLQPTDWLPEARQLLENYARGREVDLAGIDCDLTGCTPFQRNVLELVRRIPRGETLTYGEVARRVGRPNAARAVGATMARNAIPLIIPCHRVVGAKGRLTGFSAPRGIEMKRQLLDMEQTTAPVLF